MGIFRHIEPVSVALRFAGPELARRTVPSVTPNNRAMWRFAHCLPVKLLIIIRSSQLSLAMARLRPREQKRNHAKGHHAPGGA